MSNFKAKVDGYWKEFNPEVNGLLKQAFALGVPSVRFCVQGQVYKFDFKRMEEKNLITGETRPMCAPLHLKPPPKPRIAAFGPRPVFAVKVPPGAAGKEIEVPHPKKLGKKVAISVPKEAMPGQPMFVPIPASWRKKAKKSLILGGGGAAVGAGAALATQELAVGGAAAAAGGSAALAGAAPFVLGGIAVAGAVAAGAAAVNYTTKHPGKAVALGVLAVGGLAAADYVAEHGVVEAAGDLVEGVGDAVEGTAEAVGDAVEGTGAAAEELDDAFSDAGEFLVDAADGMYDVILDLF